MNNDLISRDALIQNLESHKMTEVFPNWQDGMSIETKRAIVKYANRIRLEIQNAPTVDRETLSQGEWLPPRVGAYGCTCSNCNKQKETLPNGKVCPEGTEFDNSERLGKFTADNDYDYCPNCGAKMGGTEG